MKKLLCLTIYFLCTLILGFSCKKDKPSIAPANIVGQWKWVSTYPAGNPNSFPHFPLTPDNTGVQEALFFNSDRTYKWIKNNVVIDSGTFSTGHNVYTPYPGYNTVFIYDSICYYHNGLQVNGGVDYYKVASDTLAMIPYLAGKFSGSYTLSEGGSKEWKKE